MPKIVDHAQRRRELAAAVWQVIAEHGLAAASVRGVARQAGWSPSSVQYYFRTQAELLTFAMQTIATVSADRLEEPAPDADPVEAAVATLSALLPLGKDSRIATQIWLAFLAQTLVDENIAALNNRFNAQVAAICRELVSELSPRSSDDELELEASRLQALFDGIAMHAVTDPAAMPPDKIRRLLRRHIEALGEAG